MAISFVPLTFSDSMPSGYALDENFSKVKTALQDAISRTSSTNNEMQVDLDMNGQRVLNLPEPTLSTEAARLADVQAALSGGGANLITFTPYDFITADNVQLALEQVVDAINERVTYVSTIADLQALSTDSLADGQQVQVTEPISGLYGSSTFSYDASSTDTADGVVTVAPDTGTGRWTRKLDGHINVLWYGADPTGAADSVDEFNAAIVKAVSTSSKLYVPAGSYLVTGTGTSATDGIKIPSGTATASFEMCGDGMGSTIIHQDSTSRFALSINTGEFEAGPNPDTDNSKNIKIHDITFESEVVTAGFLEQHHQLSMSAVSHVEIYNCEFKGFRGDGFYLGSSAIGGIERHNRDVSIHHCLFDGVNKDNRNGISIIDGDGVHIYENKFINCTRPDMPSPIDVEPNNNTFVIVRFITIEKNSFYNCGGEAGLVTFYLNNAYNYAVEPEFFTVSENYFADDNTSAVSVFFTAFDGTVPLSDASHDYNIVVKNNRFHDSLVIYGVKGVSATGNTWHGKGLVLFGDEEVASYKNVIDCHFYRNNLQSATAGAGPIHITNAQRIRIEDNNIKGDGAVTNYGITFYGNGVTTVSDNITISNNRFDDFLLNDIHISSHTLDPASTYISRNRRKDGGRIAINSSIGFVNDVLEEGFQINYPSSKLPDSFSVGNHLSLVNGDAGLPDANEQGVLQTIKPSSSTAFRKFVVQWFYPANNPGDDLKVYWRKGNVSSNIWDPWVIVTGTAA